MGIKKVVKDLVFGTLGAGMGYSYSLYREVAARANVAVRPELVKVDWLTALLSNQFGDWVFYHYPTGMRMFCSAMGFVGGYLLLKYIERS